MSSIMSYLQKFLEYLISLFFILVSVLVSFSGRKDERNFPQLGWSMKKIRKKLKRGMQKILKRHFKFIDRWQNIFILALLRQKIEDGEWKSSDLFYPTIISFADLKKYHYYYWEGYPLSSISSLIISKPKIVLLPQRLTQ